MMEHCLKEKDWGEQKQINKTFFAHISEGQGWRISILGIVFAIAVQIITFASMWGRLTTKVEYQEKTIDRILEKFSLGAPLEAAEKR